VTRQRRAELKSPGMGMDSDSESDSNSEIPNGTGNAYGLWPGENKSQTHPVLATWVPLPNPQIADQLRFSLLGARSTGEKETGDRETSGGERQLCVQCEMERKCVRRSTVKQLQKTNKLTNPIKNNSSAKPDKKQSQNKANSIGLA